MHRIGEDVPVAGGQAGEEEDKLGPAILGEVPREVSVERSRDIRGCSVGDTDESELAEDVTGRGRDRWLPENLPVRDAAGHQKDEDRECSQDSEPEQWVILSMGQNCVPKCINKEIASATLCPERAWIALSGPPSFGLVDFQQPANHALRKSKMSCTFRPPTPLISARGSAENQPLRKPKMSCTFTTPDWLKSAVQQEVGEQVVPSPK